MYRHLGILLYISVLKTILSGSGINHRTIFEYQAARNTAPLGEVRSTSRRLMLPVLTEPFKSIIFVMREGWWEKLGFLSRHLNHT